MRSIGVGVFVLGGLLLFTIALFLIGERRMLFRPKFEVFTEFAAVSGLQPGSEVRVAGMAAGEVTSVVPPASPSGRFRVGLEILEELRPLVRTDSVASIRTQGVVGNQFLQVSIGSEGAAVAEPGGTILSREPFELADLLAQASETIASVNRTILDVRGDIEDVLRVIATAGADADTIIREAGVEVRGIARAGNRIAADTEKVVQGVREGRGSLGKFITDDEIYRRATAIAAETEEAVGNLREATAQATETLQALTGKGGTVEGLSANLRESLLRASTALTNIEETTEALKHNWFFRGYFRRRGYFSLSDISPAQYRGGILEENNRVPLRIWLRADLVFTETPEGELAIAPGGEARLDSAITEYLDFTGPLMIEGYAAGGYTADRLVLSQRRADAVRTYLIRRFDINPANIGIMPLGAEAPGSPSDDDRWDGVALAIFVEREALQPRQRR